jgi:aminopeptidase YwaD
MNTRLLLLPFAVLLSTHLIAQEDYGREIVKELAADKYYGRGFVFDGDKKAANFIKSTFEKNDVLPIEGNADDYFQYFNLSPNVFPKQAKLKINGKRLELGREYLVDAASKSINGAFELVKLDIEKIDTQSMGNTLNSEVYANRFLLVDEEEATAQLTGQGYKKLLDLLKKEGSHAGAIVNSRQKLLWRTLTYQIDKPVFYLRDWKGETGKVEVSVNSEQRHGYTTQNVCGFIPGTGESDSIIVITAHYDHIGAIGRKVVFNGANDNASGTAMMLYLSRYFQKNRPKYNMVFLAFSAEESGLLGSIHFAKNPLIDLSKIKFLLNLDMAGTGDDGIQVVNGTIFRSEFDRLVRVNAEKSYLPQVLERGAMNRSDHFPFYEKGVPCFFIYTLGGIAAYHDVYDVYETLPFTNFSNYGNLLTDYIETF